MLSITTMKSFALLALAALVERAVCVPQDATITPQPIVLGTAEAVSEGSGSTSAGYCDACYLVADIAAVVWYSEVFINTVATELVNVGVGNGTRTTRTSIVQNEAADVTFDMERMNSAFPTDLALSGVVYDSTANVNGAILTSPTAYNVYSAYSITSERLVSGRCMMISGTAETPSSPFSQTLASASGRVTVDPAGLQSFIDSLGFTECSGGATQSVTQSALVPIAEITETSTSTNSRVYSLPGMQSLSLAATTNPTSTSKPVAVVTLTDVMSSTTVTATLTGTAYPSGSASAPLIVVGSSTITPPAAPVTFAAVDVGGISPDETLSSIETAVGTADGTGVGNYSTVPFLNGVGNLHGSPTIILGTALASIVLVVGLL